MIQELVYTSAPKGLKPGSVGFCTVASTRGMAPNLAKFLAVQSRYRHLIPPGSPGAESNPVNYSHVKSRIGGKDFYVLSRVADAGLDYSNRSNMLAHHFAIDDVRSLGCGPSSILKKEEQFFCEWTKEPTKLDPRIPLGISSQPKPCNQWESVTGDAGWAGDVIEAFTKKTLVYIVIDPSIRALDLVNETLSLIPVEQQWDFTFSTFYTKGSGDVDCGIRFIMEGSAEVALARRSRANLVLDLTKSLGQSRSKFADNARSGKLLFDNKPTLVSTKLNDTDSVEKVEKSSADLPPVDQSNGQEIDDDPPELPSTQLQQKTHLAPPTLKGGYKPKLPKSEIVVTERGSKLGPVVFAASLLFLLIGLGAAFPFVFGSAEVANVDLDNESNSKKKKEASPKAPAETEAAKEKAAKEKATKEKAAKEKATKEKAAKEKAAKEKAAKEKAAKEKAAKEKAEKEKAEKEAEQKAAWDLKKSETSLSFQRANRTLPLSRLSDSEPIGDVIVESKFERAELLKALVLRYEDKVIDPKDGVYPVIIKQSGNEQPIGEFQIAAEGKAKTFKLIYSHQQNSFGHPDDVYEKSLNAKNSSCSRLVISLFGKKVEINLSELDAERITLDEKRGSLKSAEVKSLHKFDRPTIELKSANVVKVKFYDDCGNCQPEFTFNYQIDNQNELTGQLVNLSFAGEVFEMDQSGNTWSMQRNNWLIEKVADMTKGIKSSLKNKKESLEQIDSMRGLSDKEKRENEEKKNKLENEIQQLQDQQAKLVSFKSKSKIGKEKVVIVRCFSSEKNEIFILPVSYELDISKLSFDQNKPQGKSNKLRQMQVNPHGVNGP